MTLKVRQKAFLKAAQMVPVISKALWKVSQKEMRMLPVMWKV